MHTRPGFVYLDSIEPRVRMFITIDRGSVQYTMPRQKREFRDLDVHLTKQMHVCSKLSVALRVNDGMLPVTQGCTSDYMSDLVPRPYVGTSSCLGTCPIQQCDISHIGKLHAEMQSFVLAAQAYLELRAQTRTTLSILQNARGRIETLENKSWMQQATCNRLCGMQTAMAQAVTNLCKTLHCRFALRNSWTINNASSSTMSAETSARSALDPMTWSFFSISSSLSACNSSFIRPGNSSSSPRLR